MTIRLSFFEKFKKWLVSRDSCPSWLVTPILVVEFLGMADIINPTLTFDLFRNLYSN